jgi:hypothetical protein
MNAVDFQALKTPLIVLLVVLAATVAVPYYTNLQVQEAKRALAQQQTQMRDARTRLQKSGEEKDIIVRYLAAYQSLQRVGFVGDEQRINWLDGLRVANQQTQLFGVDYQIGAQQPYPYASELNPGQLALYQSVMKINLRLLHEEDLLRFLGALAKQRAGVFSVSQCSMERVDTGGSIRYQPNLRAECDLAWITMRPATTGDKKS